MLVYGDVERQETTAGLRREIADTLRAAATMPAGLDRHARLVTAFLRAAALVTGVVDARFTRNGADTEDEVTVAGMLVLMRLASAVVASWGSGYASSVPDPPALLAQIPDEVIRTKIAEGYGFYALYPESYAEAARRSGLPHNTRVIGIRSIGTSLSAMVAVGLGAAAPLTVRPIGHPFDRRLAIDAGLSEAMLAGDPPAFAIVDEGPGLSGSSFGAVADWLEAHGVAPERIHFFPSHGGDPGPRARPDHLARWRRAPRHLVSFDELFVASGRLGQAVGDVIGTPDRPLTDLSGGGWRNGCAGKAEAPVAPQWERRKFLAERDGRRYLVKFAGLGGEADRKRRIAQKLRSIPQVIGCVHGFLVEEWIEGTPLESAFDRQTLIEHLARYLAGRAWLAAPPDAGASGAALTEMATTNIGEALGPEVEACASRRLARLESSLAFDTRIEIDGRLHRWEWVVRDGALVKTDALDHSRTHDFIGAQPLSWDIAGATIELELSPAETAALLARLNSERIETPGDLDAIIIAYLGFQLGAWTMACGADAPIVGRYRRLIAGRLTSSPGP